MSLEVSLQNIADALNNLAASNRACAEATLATNVGYVASVQAYATAAGKAGPTDAQVDAEIDAKIAAKEKADEQAKQKAELEKSVAEVEAAAKNEGKSAAGTATQAAGTLTTAGTADTATAGAQMSYDYAKDVAPVLTKVAQKSRDNLVALLAKFGAKKGNEVKADDYAAVLAEANKLIGG